MLIYSITRPNVIKVLTDERYIHIELPTYLSNEGFQYEEFTWEGVSLEEAEAIFLECKQ